MVDRRGNVQLAVLAQIDRQIRNLDDLLARVVAPARLGRKEVQLHGERRIDLGAALPRTHAEIHRPEPAVRAGRHRNRTGQRRVDRLQQFEIRRDFGENTRIDVDELGVEMQVAAVERILAVERDRRVFGFRLNIDGGLEDQMVACPRQRDIGNRRAPCRVETPVVDRQVAVLYAELVEIAESQSGSIGRGHFGNDARRKVAAAGRIPRVAEFETAVGLADDEELGPNDGEPARPDFTAKQRAAAERYRHFGNVCRRAAVTRDDMCAAHADFQDRALLRPGEDRVLEMDIERRFAGIERFLEIRRQEREGNRAGRKPPCRDRHQDQKSGRKHTDELKQTTDRVRDHVLFAAPRLVSGRAAAPPLIF